MLDFLDLPKYIAEHGGIVDDVKFVCVLNRQIPLPNHLKPLNSSSTNLPSLVDIIGIDIGGRKYFVKGQVVVMLGSRAFDSDDKRVLLLNGSARILPDKSNYVEVTLIFTSNTGVTNLYATRTLFRDIPSIRCVYPEFMNHIDSLARMNWNYSLFYNQFQLPNTYHESCGSVTFEVLDEKDKFIYKSEEDYKKLHAVEATKNIILDSPYKSLMSQKKKLECRDTILKKTPKCDYFESVVCSSEKKVMDKIEEFSVNVTVSEIEPQIDFLHSQLVKYFNRTPRSDSFTGRALLKSVLEHIFDNYKGIYVGNVPLIDDSIDNKDLLSIWYSNEIPVYLKDNTFLHEVLTRREEIYIGVIDTLLGLRNHLVNCYAYGLSLDIDVYSIIRSNPYYLCLIDNRLTVEDLDKLALLYNISLNNVEVIKFRNISYLHNFMLDSNNPFIEDNTLILKSDIVKNVSNGYILSNKSYNLLLTVGTILPEKNMNNLKSYIKHDLSYTDFALQKNNWVERKVKGSSKYVRPIDSSFTGVDAVKNYIDSGLGLELVFDKDIYLMDFSYAVKEQYIINKLYSLQEFGYKPTLSTSNIEKCIRAFEVNKSLEMNIPNFKLELRQTDAVKLLYNPVLCLTGPAGSGKTTTAEAILFGLQALLDVEEDDIMFAAPTGKAANRLKEIVKKPTRTINSLFGIGSESHTLIKERKVKEKTDIKVLIIDESSMINLELMFNMLSKVADGTRVIFLGDREQLPPIGPGKPFANFLVFLPCIVLDVPKRASEGSYITRNANYLINESDISTPRALEQGDDFRMLEVPKNKIVELVSGIINYHLGNAGSKRVGSTMASKRVLQSLDVDLSPDDIQVVTPVNKYEWGTKALNTTLQNVFNPKNYSECKIRYSTGYEYKTDSVGNKVKEFTYIEYRLNDRVIHLENSMKQRFALVGKNTLQPINSQGVMNGDIGKIKAFIKGTDLKFILDDGSEDTTNMASYLRDDTAMYLVVSYVDVDEFGALLDYCILYKMNILHDSSIDALTRSENTYTVDGLDLKKLDLAYALTVHKLQGSQAKLLITVMYNVGYGSFISRNMLYTAITRAIEGIYLVGNVTGFGNSISKGRKYEQNSLRLTSADKMF